MLSEIISFVTFSKIAKKMTSRAIIVSIIYVHIVQLRPMEISTYCNKIFERNPILLQHIGQQCVAQQWISYGARINVCGNFKRLIVWCLIPCANKNLTIQLRNIIWYFISSSKLFLGKRAGKLIIDCSSGCIDLAQPRDEDSLVEYDPDHIMSSTIVEAKA